ncbi:hypothetical protein SteCoe_20816 [Stentor coeruleus]|uniref:EF-hand domain-containing protein n=1 Tax=Stentor coeruleus TaxID=5963 RepID=A0A1R2BR49_9CILI|nr:hypothetical protein SteCoe_20816 [Stentor coeruleus]
MGCADSKEWLERSFHNMQNNSLVENELILNACRQVEKSLGLEKFSSVDLDNHIHRYSYDDEITNKNLNKVAKIMGFDYAGKEKFYSQFTTNKLIVRKNLILNSRQIRTLSIILGNSDEVEKAKLLFKNYDLNLDNFLDKNELLLQIDDILWISIETISNYTISFYFTNECLVEEADKMKSSINYIKSELISKFLVNENCLDLVGYMKKFLQKNIKIILYPRRVRKYSLEVYKKNLEIKANDELVNKKIKTNKGEKKKYKINYHDKKNEENQTHKKKTKKLMKKQIG